MFEFRLPDLGEGIHEGEILKWYVKEGDMIKEEAPLCDIETDKAAVTIPSPKTGKIVSLNGKPGDIVNVNDVIVVIDDGSKKDKVESDVKKDSFVEEKREELSSDSKISGEKTGRKAVAAPAVRRLAREMDIDINLVEGSGPAGRVTGEDLEKFRNKPSSEKDLIRDDLPEVRMEAVSEPVKFKESSFPFFEIFDLPEEKGEYEEVPIVSLRRKTAVKTATSKILMPHVAHMDEIDVTGLEKVREEYNRKYGDGGKLTLLAFLIKAMASLLRRYPEFNSSIDNSKMTLRLKKYYNIGFACDTKKGLMVPVVKNADTKSLSEVGKSVKELSLKARDGKINVDDLSGGTFTITNVGTLGGTYLFPVINYPESAILGMGSVSKKPVVVDDEIVIRTILPVSFCFDHRVADGANAARMVGDLKDMLEDSIKYTAWI